jgi:hypothetical protein
LFWQWLLYLQTLTLLFYRILEDGVMIDKLTHFAKSKEKSAANNRPTAWFGPMFRFFPNQITGYSMNT